jgi:diguanylate cyclase
MPASRGPLPADLAMAVATAVLVTLLAAVLAWGFAIVLPGWMGGKGAWVAAAAAALGAGLALVPLAARHLGVVRELGRLRGRPDTASPGGTASALGSREGFLALAEREFHRSRRYGHGAALLLVDLDRFRRLDEGRGAGVGERAVQELVQHIARTLRGADALARFGPAQVAVFLAQADALGSLDAAERIRERVEQLEIAWQRERLRVTVSVGVALMRPAHLTLQAVLDDAEAALGAARHAGGNCVRSAPVDVSRRRTAGPSVDGNRAAGPTL